MSAIGDIKTASLANSLVVTTSATVGVDKTFNPEGFNPQGIAQWVDRSGGIPVGFPRLSLQMRRPTKDSRNYRISIKLALPTLEVTAPTTVTGIQPAPTKAYDCSAFLEFVIPERASAAEREALFCHTLSLFGTTINASDGAPTDATGSPLYGAVKNLDQPY